MIGRLRFHRDEVSFTMMSCWRGKEFGERKKGLDIPTNVYCFLPPKFDKDLGLHFWMKHSFGPTITAGFNKNQFSSPCETLTTDDIRNFFFFFFFKNKIFILYQRLGEFEKIILENLVKCQNKNWGKLRRILSFDENNICLVENIRTKLVYKNMT